MGRRCGAVRSSAWPAAIAAIGLVAGAGSAGATPAPGSSAEPTVTVAGQLNRIVIDGPTASGDLEARGEIAAYVSIGGTRVRLDAALAQAARSGRVELTLSGVGLAGRATGDLGELVRRGSAHVVGVRSLEADRTAPVLGTHHAVVVPVYWSGSPQPPTNAPSATDFAGRYWTGNTDAKIDLTIDKVYPATRITPSSETLAACDVDALFREVEEAIPAPPNDIMHHVIGVLPAIPTCHWAGVASLGTHSVKAPIFLVNGEEAGLVYAHEFGHNLMLTHDGALTCWQDAGHTATVPVSGDCERQTYDDPWDIMGNRNAGALASGNRWRLGVIPDSARHTVTGDDSVTIAPVAAAGGVRSVVFTDGDQRYEVEYRTPTGWDAWIDNEQITLPGGTVMTSPGGGIIVRSVLDPDTDDAEYDVVNFHPWGDVTYSARHSGLEPGERYTFPSGVTIAVESATASGAKVTFGVPAQSAVSRWSGADRYETSAVISRNGFAEPTGKVFLASGSLFPDALSGAEVAAWAKGPLMLVKRDTLTAPVSEELDQLGSFATTLFGGPSAIGEDIPLVLATYGTVRRLAGADRYATSAAISKASFAPGVSVAYVASGQNFPDALSGAPVAGKNRAPMLLTAPDPLPATIGAELARVRPKSVVVLGGPAAVSDAVLAQIKSKTGVTPTRVSGADRYAVSALISKQNFADGAAQVFIASGENFADALAGGPVAGARKAPMLLVKADSVPGAVATELTRLHPKSIVILGGPASISPDVATSLEDYLG